MFLGSTRYLECMGGLEFSQILTAIMIMIITSLLAFINIYTIIVRYQTKDSVILVPACSCVLLILVIFIGASIPGELKRIFTIMGKFQRISKLVFILLGIFAFLLITTLIYFKIYQCLEFWICTLSELGANWSWTISQQSDIQLGKC